MASQVIGKIWIDGMRVLVLRPLEVEPSWLRCYAMKVSNIPVGMHFMDGGNGWGLITVVDHETEGAPE